MQSGRFLIRGRFPYFSFNGNRKAQMSKERNYFHNQRVGLRQVLLPSRHSDSRPRLNHLKTMAMYGYLPNKS
jgi:hypothetical protein